MGIFGEVLDEYIAAERRQFPALTFLKALLAGMELDIDGYRVRLVEDVAGRLRVCFIAHVEAAGHTGEKACGFDLPLEQFLSWANRQSQEKVWEVGMNMALHGAKRGRG